MIEIPKYTVGTMQVSREQVFAYVSRRGEEEVIVL